MHPSWMAGNIYPWMTWEEVRDTAAEGLPVVLPVGSTEQHGPHLPLCTDWVLPTEMARRAGEIRDIVIGPPVTFGYRSRPGSGGGQQFPGTTSLSGATFMGLVEDVLGELIRSGFTNVLLYNWHFENVGFVYESACLVSERHPEAKIVVVEDALPAFTEEERELLWPDGFPGLDLEHAAVIETSLWLEFQPEAVRLDRMRADRPERHPHYDVLPIDPTLSTASGSLSSPLGASLEKGKLLARRTVDHLLGVLDAEFSRPAELGTVRPCEPVLTRMPA
jgi:creatinine amidohydrolase